MKAFSVAFLFLFVFNQVEAQVTFCEHIAPIVYSKCSGCHHPGGIAPLALTNYAEVKHASMMITHAALDPKTRFMPPWMPDTSYSHFVDERTLSTNEVQSLKQWIADGMPEGNKGAEPELPMFPKGSALGKPDLVLSMKEPFLHTGNNKDEYRVFVLPTHLTEGHNVGAIEIVPGNPKIAHHIILGLDTTDRADKRDAQTPEYGYEQYGGFGFYPTYDNWSGWVPGNRSRFFPAGISNYILPNSKVLLQMHYGPSPVDTKDSTVVNIFYSDKPVNRYIKGWVISPNDLKDGPFFIEANTKKTFHAQFRVTGDYSLFSVTPHAHWLGKQWEVYAIHPNGDTTHLIKINDWDFNWQNFFNFKQFVHLEKGTMIYCNATYDNTDNNFRNPNHPVKNVMWGESAKDEMFLFYFAYVPYQASDENKVIGGNANYMNVANDNSTKKAVIEYSVADNTLLNLKLCDDKGKTVKQLINKEPVSAGKHQTQIGLDGLKAGTYWFKLATDCFTDSRRLVVE